MTLALPHTGSSLGDYEQMSSYAEVTVEGHTRLRKVDNPALRDALGYFDSALTTPMRALGFLRSVTGRSETFLLEKGVLFFDVISAVVDQAEAAPALVAGHDDAVAVVEGLAKKLGVPVRDVRTAAGISHSTYFSWKKPAAPRPRVASQGQLWTLVQAVEDLEKLVGPDLRGWLLADPARLERLRDGDFDALLRDAVRRTRKPSGAPEYAAVYGVGGDRTENDETGVAVARRRTLPAPPVARRAVRRPR